MFEIKTDDPLIIEAILKGIAAQYGMTAEKTQTTIRELSESHQQEGAEQTKRGRKPLFTNDQVKKIKNYRENGYSIRWIAEKFGATPMTISRYLKT